MDKRVFVSVIIPVPKINDYIRKETLPAILAQRYQNFEVIVLPDKPTREKLPRTKIVSTYPKTGPADKRDLGVKKAKGEIIAFLDDDSYPKKNWLKNALRVFGRSRLIAAVGGPSLTPPANDIWQKASGYVWSSWLGSGGAGTYRCAVGRHREVDDFPTVNLLVRKQDFLAVGGFNSHFWPGEDTKLCLDLTKELGKKIIYDPQVLVYHHRRRVFGPHLKQISRYAIHRGHFARIFPETSFRIGYLIPTFFVLGLIGGPIFIFMLELFRFRFLSIPLLLFYSFTLLLYLVLLLWTILGVYQKEKNLGVALLVVPSIFLTHLFYGILFPKGFFSSRLER